MNVEKRERRENLYSGGKSSKRLLVLLMIRGRKTRDYTTAGQVRVVQGFGVGVRGEKELVLVIRFLLSCRREIVGVEELGGCCYYICSHPSLSLFLHTHTHTTHTTERASCTSLLKQVKQRQTVGKQRWFLGDYERDMLWSCWRVRSCMTVCKLFERLCVSQKHTRVEKSSHGAKPSKQECLCCSPSLCLCLSILFRLPSVPHCFILHEHLQISSKINRKCECLPWKLQKINKLQNKMSNINTKLTAFLCNQKMFHNRVSVEKATSFNHWKILNEALQN